MITAESMDSQNEDMDFDPMEAITEKVLDALKPRKRQCMRARKYKRSAHEGGDPKVFVDFADRVLAPTATQVARLRARELMNQLDAKPVPSPIRDSAALAVKPSNADSTNLPLSSAERDFASFVEVFVRVSDDIELECHDRGLLFQRLIAKAKSAFETVRNMAKDKADDVENLRAQVKHLEAENKLMQQTIRDDKENRDKMTVTLATLRAQNSYQKLTIEQKTAEVVELQSSLAAQETALLKTSCKRSALSRVQHKLNAVSKFGADASPRDSVATRSDAADMVDGSTSPMMMFSFFHNSPTGGTFMTQEDDAQLYDFCGRSRSPMNQAQDGEQTKFGVFRSPAEEVNAHPRLVTPDRFFVKTESPHRRAHNSGISSARSPIAPPYAAQEEGAASKPPSLSPSVSSCYRGTNVSRCSSRGSSRHAPRHHGVHVEHRTSKSSSTSALRSKTRRLSFPTELPFSNFVSLKSDWEFTHDPHLLRAKAQAEAQLAEAHREVQTQMTVVEHTASAFDKVLRMISASVGRVQRLLDAHGSGAAAHGGDVSTKTPGDVVRVLPPPHSGVGGRTHFARDFSALLSVLTSVLGELGRKSCHEWAHIDVDTTLIDFNARFDLVCDDFMTKHPPQTTFVPGVDKPEIVPESISTGTHFLKKAGDGNGIAGTLSASARPTLSPLMGLRSLTCGLPLSKSSTEKVFTSQVPQTEHPVRDMKDADVQTDFAPSGSGVTRYLVPNSASSCEDLHSHDVAMKTEDKNGNRSGESVPSSREENGALTQQRNQDSGSHSTEDACGALATSAQSNGSDVIAPVRRVEEQIMLLRSRFADLIDLSRLSLRRHTTVWPLLKIAKFIDSVYGVIWEKICAQAKNDASAPVLPTSEVSTMCWDVLRRQYGCSEATSAAHEKAMQLIDTLSDALQNDTSRTSAPCTFVDYLVGTRTMGELTFHLYVKALRAHMVHTDILSLLFGDLPRAYARGLECKVDDDSTFQVLTAYRDCQDVACWKDVSHAFVMADLGATRLRGKVSYILSYGSADGKLKSLGAFFYMAHKAYTERHSSVLAIADAETPQTELAVAVKPMVVLTELSGNAMFKAFHDALKHSVEMFDRWLADSITRCMKMKDDANLITVVLHALTSRLDLRGALLPVVVNALTEISTEPQ